MIYAVKPHTDKVTMVSLQTEANLIVTGSQDCTLFFFRFVTSDRGIDMDPIRCITLEHVAINFEWISLQVRVLNVSGFLYFPVFELKKEKIHF